MLTIGLAGGSGSGKGTVCSIFKGFGIEFIDTDALYAEMVLPRGKCIPPLVAEFGSEILNGDGSLNRSKLAAIVFMGEDSIQKRKRLDEITHKIILDEARLRLKAFEARGVPATLVDAPLLFESGFDRECDLIISVIADENIRVGRITARDGISEEMARKRIASQLPDELLQRSSDYVIVNNGTIEELRRSVSSVAEKILK